MITVESLNDPVVARPYIKNFRMIYGPLDWVVIAGTGNRILLDSMNDIETVAVAAAFWEWEIGMGVPAIKN